jgi:CheY-like chemotaxis protein
VEDRNDTRRLLLIDDSAIALEFAEFVLSDAGFEVRTASSLQVFQETLATWKPHLIVTDLNMPEMSGVELCQWLRHEIATARIPLVLCSSTPDKELAKIAQDVRADAYFSKTDGLEALPALLNKLCDEILW